MDAEILKNRQFRPPTANTTPKSVEYDPDHLYNRVMLSLMQRERATAMIAGGAPTREVAKRYGVPIYELLDDPPPDPTPEEIRTACFEIQRTWTDKIRHDRAPWAVEAQKVVIPAYRAENTPEGSILVPEDCARLAPSDQPEVLIPGKLAGRIRAYLQGSAHGPGLERLPRKFSIFHN